MSRKPHFETETAEEDLGGAAPRNMNNHERRIALFIDFENIAIGVTDAKYKKFEVSLLLERLLEGGEQAVRLGHPARVLPALREHTLDLLVEDQVQVLVERCATS